MDPDVVAAMENRLMVALQAEITPEYLQEQPQLEGVVVSLVGRHPLTAVRFLWRERSRPGCRFGFLWPDFWEWIDPLAEVPFGGTPEGIATIIWVNFEEARCYLPDRCDSTRITWIGEAPRPDQDIDDSSL